MKKKLLWLCSILCLIVMMSGCKLESVEQHDQMTEQMISEQIKAGEAADQNSQQENTEEAQQKKQQEEVQEGRGEIGSASANVASEQQVETPQKNDQSSAPSYSQEQTKEEGSAHPLQYVTISIEASTILNHMDQLQENKRPYVPSDGYILYPAKVAIQEGDSVADILSRVTRTYRIHMELQGSGSSVYIQGINQLYEFDCGNLSGWMYSVNGAYVSVGAGAKQVNHGDVIQWLYTCDSGRDLNLK